MGPAASLAPAPTLRNSPCAPLSQILMCRTVSMTTNTHHTCRSPANGATPRRLFQRFELVHLYVFLGFYLTFAALTYFALNSGSESDRRQNAIVTATVGAVSGPFTGAIARNFQPCCLQSSLAIFPYCAFLLGLGVLCQIVPLPFQRFAGATRLTLWCIGLLGWFGGVLVSFLHALS